MEWKMKDQKAKNNYVLDSLKQYFEKHPYTGYVPMVITTYHIMRHGER